MKLSSYLKLSRHGIYYYRLQYKAGDNYKEINVSLGTRDPELAKGLPIRVARENSIDTTSSWDETPQEIVFACQISPH